MNALKKLGLAGGGAVASMALMASSAFAAPVVNTGNHFTYTSTNVKTQVATVSNTNTASIGQTSFSGANTGGNRANRNILGGFISTGDAGVSTTQVVSANNNWTYIRF